MTLIGKKMLGIKVESGGQSFTLEMEDGPCKLYVHGDCCSQSWIEHADFPAHLEGATLLEVIENDMDRVEVNDSDGYTEVVKQYYQTVFRTDRGDATLEYRNDSNGYYGGSISTTEEQYGDNNWYSIKEELSDESK